MKRPAIINSFIMLAVISLVSTIYSAEDFSVDKGADVKFANEAFKEELRKLAKDLLERGNVVEPKEGFVEDSRVLCCLMYLCCKFTKMDSQAKEKYKRNFCFYRKYLDNIFCDKKIEFGELDDELDNLNNFFLKDPDILLIQEFLPIRGLAEEDFLFKSRRFLQKIHEGELDKKILLEENMQYCEKRNRKRLEEIKEILVQYRKCFGGSRKKLMKKAKKWAPKTSEESLLAREIMYSLFEMVRSNNKDLKFPFNNVQKHRKNSRFDFATKKDTIVSPLVQ